MKQDVVYTVKSHQRVDRFRKKTYEKIILKYQFPLDRVYVFISTSEDLKLYRAAFPDINVVKAPRGIVGVDNFITDYFKQGQRIVYMNDDVSGVQILTASGKFRHLTPREMSKLITDTFSMMEKHNISYGGVYPVRNNLFMAGKPTVTFDFTLIMDPFSFVVNDKSIRITVGDKSDFEKSILHFKKRGALLRHNCLALTVEYYGTQGGFQGRDAQTEMKTARRMQRKYPKYITGVTVKKHGRTSLKFARIAARDDLPVIKKRCAFKKVAG